MSYSAKTVKTLEQKAQQLLSKAGVTINGPEPYDIQVKDKAAYDRVFSDGAVGLGETYMDGMWDVEDMSDFFFRVLRADIDDSVKQLGTLWYYLQARFGNLQNQKRAFQVGEEHYDIGNELYKRMLDKRLVYTCGYWSSPTTPAKNLDDAQEQKLDLVCRKIGLKPGQTVLDIGCGWGSFLKFAAEKYGAKGIGITVSKEQAALARENCKGLDVEIRIEDYRDTEGTFDHVISLGMFEHVGPKNYHTYMEKAHSLLKDGGFFLLHTIGSEYSVWTSDPWFHKYIFPNGVLPSVAQMGEAIDRLFILEDWHNFGPDYDKTLMAWWENFDRSWPEIKKDYSERFYRMWRYYLLSMAGCFRARDNQLWQLVLTKKGIVGGYQSVR